MASETSPRLVRFSQNDEEQPPARPEKLKNGHRPGAITIDSGDSGSSGDSHDNPNAFEQDDELSALERYAEATTHSVSMPSLVSPTLANGSASRQRSGAEAASYSNGTPARPQRPTGPARTPSNTYQPYTQRRPTQPPNSSFAAGSGPHARDGSRPRPIGTSTFRAQEREYVRRLRQQDYNDDYFDAYGSGEMYDSDSEGETPSSEGPFDSYDDAHIMFVHSEASQITEEDLKDVQNRERLEWHGMLEAVLTGDVVRQEKKRLIGSTDEDLSKSAVQKAELWLGIRSRACGRHLPVQRRIIEDARAMVDRSVNDIINFSIAGESEAGKPPIEQVRDVVAKIEKIESLFPSSTALVEALKPTTYAAYQETCEAVISWYNVNEMINTELSILKKWVGNDALDFQRAKEKSPSGNGLSDESSFLDRLMKEEGLKSLHEDSGQDKTSLRKKSMLDGISMVIMKAKDTLIQNAEAFQKRHLPPYIEELLTLISFPSRLIEEIIKVRLAYAKKMKDSAQQNPLMQDQMISQFQVLLKLAINIKAEYMMIAQPEPRWDLPPCIDEDFDRVILDALKYYFKMLNWKLSGNKNTFKEAELLFQEWGFGNEIGSHLTHGDVEVAEQFSSLTYKAWNRLSQTFEKELQRGPKESVSEMTKRYKQTLDSVRVRQRMLQRFSRMLGENYENACDFTIAFGPDRVQDLFDRLMESGHFQICTGNPEHRDVVIVASPNLRNRHEDIHLLMSTFSYQTSVEDPTDPYILIIRAESPPEWFGAKLNLKVREEPLDIKLGHMRLVAGGTQARLVNARKSFIDTIDMQIDPVVEQRSNLQKVNYRLMEIRKVAFKLSNAFMDSVETIRRQTRGLNCQELIQTCFIFATEFGQRSLLYMDNNRRSMNNLKLTKLALDWVGFICDDCISSDRKTFRWTVQALEFAMGMTRGRHILLLGDDEYAKLRAKVAGCMALLISHFDIMGARSSVAAQAEKQRMEALMIQLKRLNKGQIMDDEEAAKYVQEHRLQELAQVDEIRKEILLERSAMGRVLEASNEVDRSLAWLSSTATNFTMRWQQGHFVGGGTFGNVYAAMNLDTGQLMAVKEIRLQDPKLIPNVAGQIRDEMRVLESVDHPNVVSYYGIEVHRDRVYMFMEFCSGGSLANLLEHGRIEDEQVIMVYALQLLEGLAYLHELRIAHRDIKPESKFPVPSLHDMF